MPKQNGLGDNFYIGGHNLNGDVSAIDSISSPRHNTTKGLTAMERIGGLHVMGRWTSTFFNPVRGFHPVLSALPVIRTRSRRTAGAPLSGRLLPACTADQPQPAGLTTVP